MNPVTIIQICMGIYGAIALAILFVIANGGGDRDPPDSYT